MTIGIYKFYNKVTGRFYVGQSKNIENRIKYHQTLLKRLPVNCQPAHYAMHEDYKKHGMDSFAYEILEECTVEQLDEREAYWMDKLDVYDPEKSYHVNMHKLPPVEPTKPAWYSTYQFLAIGQDIDNIADPLYVSNYITDFIGKYGIRHEEVKDFEDLCRRVGELDSLLKQDGYNSQIDLEHLKSLEPMIAEFERFGAYVKKLDERLAEMRAKIVLELRKVSGYDKTQTDKAS